MNPFWLLLWPLVVSAFTAKWSLHNVSATLQPAVPTTVAFLNVSVRTRNPDNNNANAVNLRNFHFAVGAPSAPGKGVRLAVAVSALNRPNVPVAFARLRFHEVINKKRSHQTKILIFAA